ncbi:protocatechuate 3,4-dioxygenase, alpha subunit [Saccharomonospora marina XMU15]|uniref:Protocatechuate 3,4-dioxygenase, alpha subunit n=1 Tax=Saccharomonospora marina XMU15 TaxID=882083 RepID=H5X4K8_9PSEU|nr:protocatechuate 3,4-dioxygenase subunit alpha [Saccharomonospora marina]EHR50012.1 protocatechuate 3,4-dioxygenase, alpha subunit [Saccharomonospora marina XMU15]
MSQAASPTFGSTPSQTVGPYLSIGLPWEDGPTVVAEGTPGAVWIRGVVTDGAGAPIPDALIETWQADPNGRFDHPDDPRGAQPGFRGFGRCPTTDDGEYGILTQLPGALPGQAPHIDVSVFARGLLHRVVTRIYFPDNAEANASDPVLASVPEERRHTLLAQRTTDGYRFDVRLQGEGETVFFDV